METTSSEILVKNEKSDNASFLRKSRLEQSSSSSDAPQYGELCRFLLDQIKNESESQEIVQSLKKAVDFFNGKIYPELFDTHERSLQMAASADTPSKNPDTADTPLENTKKSKKAPKKPSQQEIQKATLAKEKTYQKALKIFGELSKTDKASLQQFAEKVTKFTKYFEGETAYPSVQIVKDIDNARFTVFKILATKFPEIGEEQWYQDMIDHTSDHLYQLVGAKKLQSSDTRCSEEEVVKEAKENREFQVRLSNYFSPYCPLMNFNLSAIDILDNATTEAKQRSDEASQELAKDLGTVSNAIRDTEEMPFYSLIQVVCKAFEVKNRGPELQKLCSFFVERYTEHKNSPDIKQAHKDPEFVEAFCRYLCKKITISGYGTTIPLLTKAKDDAFRRSEGTNIYSFLHTAIHGASTGITGKYELSLPDGFDQEDQEVSPETQREIKESAKAIALFEVPDKVMADNTVVNHVKNMIHLVFATQQSDEIKSLNKLRQRIREKFAQYNWRTGKTIINPILPSASGTSSF